MISPAVEYNNEIRKRGGRTLAQEYAYKYFIGKYWTGGASYEKPQESTRNVNNFVPGKIYTFEYDPLHADDLDFYDTQPIMLSLGQKLNEDGSVLQLGINLNFIPFNLRKKLLDLVFQKCRGIILDNLGDLNRDVSNSQRPLPITYAAATLMLEGTGFEFAIRSYYRNRISKAKVVDYEDWFQVLLIDTERIIGDSIVNIYNYYNKFRKGEADRFKTADRKAKLKQKQERDAKGKFKKKK